jgi:hypothetical protein
MLSAPRRPHTVGNGGCSRRAGMRSVVLHQHAFIDALVERNGLSDSFNV